ncbi:MAG: ABC transporter substrate-binding protein [Oscillospiraceae bacterium]|nr:ABC transporter substrate-binding protein [Oscillospiraceae bacterium]
MKKTIALLLSLVMVMGMFAGCGASSEAKTAVNPAADPAPAAEEDTTPLVVGYSPFNEKFSPFFSETAYDQDVWSMTALSLLNSDRQGAVIMNGIDGEVVNYNGTDYTYYSAANCEIVENSDGTVDYNFTLRDDLKFSDGEPVTIDDVIFSMYVLTDPTYDGSSTLFAQPIEGLEAYRSGVEARGNVIFADGEEGYTENELYTEEQYNAFWDYYNTKAGAAFAQEIVDYCIANGYNAPDDSVAACAANWGFTLEDDATAEDFWNTILEAYDSAAEAEEVETAGHDRLGLTIAALGADYQAGVTNGESAPNITGIVKTGDYSMTVRLTQVDATAIYQLTVPIAPLHYYGDAEQYDYENNQFGFPKGDLSLVRAKTTAPMGAGPYKFIKYENGVVYFEANENYFLGCPKTKYMNFQQCMADDDKLNGVVTGTIDITDPSFSNDTVKSITDANGGEGVNGAVITTDTVDNLGYGYIGINAKNVHVGEDKGSDASKALRKAFGTVFSVYRQLGVESYYGERASVINYPISNTSWAAPQPSDDGYKVAFSTDVDGNDIYTSDMTPEQKYEAALQAALGFFEAAGYTVEDGKLTAAPEGAKLEYELLIPADGSGDHPAFMVVTEASKALATIGMNLIVTDLTNSSELWDALDAETVDMWCAAWGATVDPDMYQIYYSDIANGGANPGGDNTKYAIEDEELDTLIMDARASLDTAYRKAMYKACLDIIIDWADEIPVYQRQNAIIFSTERVNMATMTPDITTFYNWFAEIENIELNH